MVLGIAPVAIIDRQLPFEYTITSRSTDVVVMAQPNQNINHSAFRSMFEREKLSGNNFNGWFRQLKLVLRVEKKMFVIEQPLPAAPAADSEAQVLSQWNAIYDAYNEVACLRLGSMTPELHRQFENSSPYDMIKELKVMFEKQSGVERFDLIQTFRACKQEEGKPVAAYVIQMKGYVDQLERLGYMVPQDLIAGLILNGLTKDFAGFVRNYNMHNMGKTIGELHAMLIEYEKGLPKKAETPQGNDKQVYIPKPKNPKPSAKDHPAKDDTYHHCKEIQRISLTGFPAQSVGSSNTDVLDLPCLLVLITGTSQSRQHDLEEEPAPAGETSAPPAPKTAKQLAARRNQERFKSILLLAIHDEYLLKFHNVADAKSLWEGMKSRFGGNVESKKMQKNVLKHQFENFSTASNENLDKAYDRFQKLISQLEVHGAPISKEDINQKFLRSLPSSWNQISLIMRNKSDIDEIDIDDLYNNLKVYEDELKRSSGSNSATQNLAFLSYENTSSTNEVSTASGDFGVSTAGRINQVPYTLCAHHVAYSFFAQSTTSPQLENEDFQQMDGDDLEELDL
ncbi:hypothetical protein Tco_0680362 [Tanacetum coccineum]|uniref:Zinc finger, CCHC-type n=1 Tax=Tanacetum coccineum TaxID=301880 RepID=A0ABQ4XLG9_9ASTR